MDGVRGVAVLLVLLLHSWALLDLGNAAQTWLARGYASLMYFGWVGVDLFFVLSGFLITGILNATRDRPRYFYNFYGRRALRIFPLYYAFLFGVGLCLPLLRHGLGNAEKASVSAWYFVYLQNYVIAARPDGWKQGGMVDISWSLAIEEQFYLVWPLLIWLLGRKPMMWLCGLLLIAVPVFRGVLLHRGVSPMAIYVMTPTRLDGLAMGSWIALAMTGLWSAARMKSIGFAFAGLGVAGVLAMIAVHGSFGERDPLVQTYGYSAVILFFGAVIIAAGLPMQGNLVHHMLSNAVLRFFGRYSYALYLFHLPIIGVIRDTVARRVMHGMPASLSFPTLLGFQVVVIGTTVLAALISWNLFEKRFLALKHYFQDQPKGTLA